jgi:hypothetical protein
MENIPMQEVEPSAQEVVERKRNPSETVGLKIEMENHMDQSDFVNNGVLVAFYYAGERNIG